MDDKQASNSKLNVATWRERVTSSLGLSASKIGGRNKNRKTISGDQEKTTSIDKATEQKRKVEEVAADNLLASDLLSVMPEIETEDNETVENGTSNENCTKSPEKYDQSLESCSIDVDQLANNLVSLETSNNFQVSGKHFFIFFVSVHHGNVPVNPFFVSPVYHSVLRITDNFMHEFSLNPVYTGNRLDLLGRVSKIKCNLTSSSCKANVYQQHTLYTVFTARCSAERNYAMISQHSVRRSVCVYFFIVLNVLKIIT